ncbi:MAG: hypothetical protein E6Q40_04505 [Cupriavidus sp.]|nr:MAG: hypothetical protein E6Q40_04505 [Cupriavidus sp.]
MSTSDMKNAFIVSDFRDVGTGESFVAGTTVPIAAGAFGNYKAAGLVRVAAAKAAKTMDGKATPAA